MAFNPDTCLKIRAMANNCTISLAPSRLDNTHYEFSEDGENWYQDSITINSTKTCYVKGTSFPCGASFTFSANAAINGGNVMSLVDDGAGELTEITEEDAFKALFKGCSKLKTIINDLLPATTLAAGCYQEMFYDCASLTSLPARLLPATNLADYCYSQMFEGCSNISTIPNGFLPATNIANTCYFQMFYECTKLKNIPTDLLPATEMKPYCYGGMFTLCPITSLPALPATTLAKACYEYMFNCCEQITSIPENYLPATNLPDFCYFCMFRVCTGLTTLPENLLPATELSDQCYKGMFQQCSNLREIHVNFSDWNADEDSTYDWVSWVAATGDFYCPENLPIEYGGNRIPTGWTVHTFAPPTPTPTPTRNYLGVAIGNCGVSGIRLSNE